MSDTTPASSLALDLVTLSPRTAAYLAEQDYPSSIEGRIVAHLFAALLAAGTPVVSIWDGDELTPVRTLGDVFAIVGNLDEAVLNTSSGSFVLIVNGNEWDALSDYGVSLESALAPTNAWTDRMGR